MRVYILTLFPEMFGPILGSSILKRAQDSRALEITLVNVRDFAHDSHGTVDDYPYGGGPGMIMKPGPLFEAVSWARNDYGGKLFVVLMTPQGRQFTTGVARELSLFDGLILIAGHYEGFDERIRSIVDDEISIGDFVLTGGEIPAMAVVDAVSRFIPGVLGSESSAGDDSFADGLLEGPQYTRPAVFLGMEVPRELRLGDRAAILRRRRKESIRRTLLRRPDLLCAASLTYEDRSILEEVMKEEDVRNKDLC